LKILHVGNIANNAYNNAKFLRRKGVDADVLCYNYSHVMGQPEWEDSEFDGHPDEFHPEWESLDLRGFQRPGWFRQEVLFPQGKRCRQWFKGQFRLERIFRQSRVWTQAWLKYLECPLADSVPQPRFMDLLKLYPARERFEGWFAGYDLIQAYATEPIHAMLFGGGRPYVAFEHGTMREIPFEQNTTGRLLSLAYQKASKVIITNPDVIAAARRLRLKNFVFIPHPVDETKYRPLETSLREELLNQHQTELVLFAPSRHNWVLKGNDLLLKAFARFQSTWRRPAILILTAWGQEVERSQALISALKLERSVAWTAPLNKMRLIDYYNAADIVLDQFTIGTFGTVTPEAMACGKPVVLHFDQELHEWCYAEMPPVATARTEAEIFSRMMELAQDASRRVAIGQASRNWIVKYHGWELVADRQISVYREILER
jgi:glycosyltransferase involved in cell wall biosynthesis